MPEQDSIRPQHPHLRWIRNVISAEVKSIPANDQAEHRQASGWGPAILARSEDTMAVDDVLHFMREHSWRMAGWQ